MGHTGPNWIEGAMEEGEGEGEGENESTDAPAPKRRSSHADAVALSAASSTTPPAASSSSSSAATAAAAPTAPTEGEEEEGEEEGAGEEAAAPAAGPEPALNPDEIVTAIVCDGCDGDFELPPGVPVPDGEWYCASSSGSIKLENLKAAQDVRLIPTGGGRPAGLVGDIARFVPASTGSCAGAALLDAARYAAHEASRVLEGILLSLLLQVSGCSCCPCARIGQRRHSESP